MENSNLYLVNSETKQIDLFELVAKKLPYIPLGEAIVNQYLSNQLQRYENPILVDLGVGTGRQLESLIKSLAINKISLKTFRIVGIEPAYGALQVAQLRLQKAGQKYGIQFTFLPIGKRLEEMSYEEWIGIKNLDGNILVNDSFALHHIPVNEKLEDMKNGVLSNLSKLEPISIILNEPHSDHHTPDLVKRIRNAWKHFGLIFETIDQLSILESEKEEIKIFFSREIEDILKLDDHTRSERHETAEMWLNRFNRVGFRPDPMFISCITGSQCSGVCVANKGSYIGLDFNGETVISLIALT